MRRLQIYIGDKWDYGCSENNIYSTYNIYCRDDYWCRNVNERWTKIVDGLQNGVKR